MYGFALLEKLPFLFIVMEREDFRYGVLPSIIDHYQSHSVHGMGQVIEGLGEALLLDAVLYLADVPGFVEGHPGKRNRE